MDCGEKIAKYLLSLFNFVFFVVGCVLLCVGVWLVADKNSLLQLTRLQSVSQAEEFSPTSTLDHSAYILIAIGAFIFIISFLGYCGALQQNRILLTTYGNFLIIIFALQITGIVLTMVYRKQANDQARFLLKQSFSTSYMGRSSRNSLTLSWDLVMSTMQCCGVNNYTDFRDATQFVSAARMEGLGRKVPDVCCILQEEKATPADNNCIMSPSTSNSYLNTGCYDKFLYLVSHNLNIVFGCLVGVGASQLVAIVFAFCVCKASGREDRALSQRNHK